MMKTNANHGDVILMKTLVELRMTLLRDMPVSHFLASAYGSIHLYFLGIIRRILSQGMRESTPYIHILLIIVTYMYVFICAILILMYFEYGYV